MRCLEEKGPGDEVRRGEGELGVWFFPKIR